MKLNQMQTPAKLLGSAAMALMLGAVSLQAQTIKFWTTEEQPERLAKQQQLADDFKAKSGIDVEVIPVTESDLNQRATAAFAAGDLPDVIYTPLQNVLPWTEAGIVDTLAATDVVDKLDPKTFAPGALKMVETDGDYAAVPVDGWTQMILYRKDLFEKDGLAPPTNFANIEAAIDKLNDPPKMYGFVAATKVDDNYMSQVLEQIFLANGVSPVGTDGFKPLDEKKTVQVLEFYKKLADASPPGDNYWKQSRELYFAGKAAMIMWSPFILDELAGLRNSSPPMINDDPTSTALAKDTGVVTNLAGPSNPKGASWADLRYFAITTDADTDAAEQFVDYSMNDGYGQTLSIAPEGKFPTRRGTDADPNKFTKLWATLPVGVDRKAPLKDLYDPAVIDELTKGLDTAQRWGVNDGQLALASKMLNSQVINRVVRDYLDGNVSAEDAVKKMNDELSQID
ncbi:multiple sugar transport system substrate-binding protein [Thioclava dalianensis]|nr:extracellular solute-binding protein [Thioclava dalianensis]SFN08827.1 multiple sugar transport system substrate-binding protein [Thioclava dalianensis]